MQYGLNIQPQGALDFVALGALNHRLDPGVIPFRKATECKIHVSGTEFNVAANLADCFRLKTAIVTAMVDFLTTAAVGRATVVAAHSLEEMVRLPGRPRKVMLMVKAGQPVDDMIEQLLAHLEPGDLIIDNG